MYGDSLEISTTLSKTYPNGDSQRFCAILRVRCWEVSQGHFRIFSGLFKDSFSVSVGRDSQGQRLFVFGFFFFKAGPKEAKEGKEGEERGLNK